MIHLGAADLLAAYARRELSPVDVVQAVLAHAAAREGQLHALCAVDAEGALTAARASDGSVPSHVITFITGPSRTSDIELTLAIGVHGPQILLVVIIP